MADHTELTQLATQAITGDWMVSGDGSMPNGDASVIDSMGAMGSDVRHDIPAAFEAISLLLSALAETPKVHRLHSDDELAIMPGIHANETKVVLLLHVAAGQLQYVAHFCVGALPPGLAALGGTLALMYEVGTHDGVRRLFPDWQAAFYARHDAKHCFPVKILSSAAERNGLDDWAGAALYRIESYGLPCEDAIKANAQVDASIKKNEPKPN